MGDLGTVAPDLGTGAFEVRFGIGGVGVLVQIHPLRIIHGQLLRVLQCTVGPFAASRQDDFGAECFEGLAALCRHIFRQHNLEVITPLRAYQCHADAGIARGGLNQRAARLQQPVTFGLINHGHGNTVLDGAARVLPFQLGQNAYARVGAELADLHQRRIADEVQHILDNSHGSALDTVPGGPVGGHAPPATAGRIDITSPSLTGASSLPM